MALIKCEGCGKEISDKASACPHCSAPIEVKKIQTVQKNVQDDTKAILPKEDDTRINTSLNNGLKIGIIVAVFLVSVAIIVFAMSLSSFENNQKVMKSQEEKKIADSIKKAEADAKKINAEKCQNLKGKWNWNGTINQWECNINGKIITNIEDNYQTVEVERKDYHLIEAQFSPNGEHYELAKMIKESMHNPDSYEFVSGEHWINSNGTFASLKYRGTNGFGGIVTEEVVATLDCNGNIVSISR